MKRTVNAYGKSLTNKMVKRFVRPTYFIDDLISTKNCDFLLDARYQQARRAAQKQAPKNRPGWADKMGWQLHILLWAAENGMRIDGDLVECGVNTGMMSSALVSYTDFGRRSDKKLYLFDTFSGFAYEYMTSTEKRNLYSAVKYPDCHNLICQTFHDFANVKIVKGVVPDTLTQTDIKQVSFLHLDMNCVFPEVEAMKHFWPLLTPGAFILLDDYGWPKHEEQKVVADDFARSVGTSVLSLPTGQGLIIKN